MADKSYKEMTQNQDVDASQTALRKSIEELKRLTESSQKLLDHHRNRAGKEPPPQ